MAEFAAQAPVDYSSAIAQGQGLAFNPLEAQLNAARVGLAQSATQGQQIQNQAAIQALNMQKLELQRRMQFGQDMQGFVQQPTAEGLATLVGKYPEFASESENAFTTMDTAERRSTATQLGSVASLVAKGDIDSATQLVQGRITADQAAGRDSSVPKQLLGLLQSGDPAKQKSVIAVASLLAGSAVGFDKAGDFLKAIGLSQAPEKLAPGEQLKNPQTGDTIAANAPNLTAVTVTNPDGSQTAAPFNPQTGAFGAAAVSGAAAPDQTQPGGGGQTAAAGGGVQASITHVLGNEGGYNPKDANGSPTNFGINFKANASLLKTMGITPANFKNMTQDQAAQIYAQKYWPASGAEKLPANLQAPYFDAYIRSPALAKKALVQSGGDPTKFVQIASAAFQKMASNPNSGTAPYAHAWANRDAKNMAIASGGGATVAPVASPATAAPAQASPYSFGGPQPGVANTKGAPENYQWNADHTGLVPIQGGKLDPATYGGPDEIRSIALNHLQTGKWGAGGGMGGGNVAPEVQQLALAMEPKLMAEAGITPSQLPSIRSRYTSDAASLTANTGMLNGLNASENSLHTLLDQVTNTQKTLVNMGVLGGNRHLNDARLRYYTSFGTQAEQAAIKEYRLAINGAQTEYAKFMSTQTGMGNAPTTDAARNHAQSLIDEDDPQAATIAGMHRLKIEAAAKKSGVEHQNSVITSRMQSYFAPHTQAPQSELPHGAKVVGTYKGHRVIEVNGQRLVEQ